jgi:hypothetical protein
MADKVDPQVVDALTIANAKNVAEAGSVAMANLFQHQTNHARRLDMLAEAHLAKVLDNFASIDPVEAVATSKLFQGETDSGLSSLLAQLSAGQMGTKIAQSTPGDLGLEVAKLGASVVGVEAQIGGLVALVQQIMKGAMTTPPVTAVVK